MRGRQSQEHEQGAVDGDPDTETGHRLGKRSNPVDDQQDCPNACSSTGLDPGCQVRLGPGVAQSLLHKQASADVEQNLRNQRYPVEHLAAHFQAGHGGHADRRYIDP